MANTQGHDPLCWHDDDLMFLEDIVDLHNRLPDLPSQESHTAQPVTSSYGAPSIARPCLTRHISPKAPAQQRAASTAASQRLQKMNRGYQKRFKEKQKARQQKLEAELAETKAKLAESQAALEHFQLISAPANNQNAQHAGHAMQTSSHVPSIIHVAWKPPKFIDDHIMGQLLQTPWTTNRFILCTLPEEQEAACQQVARLPRQQLATILRVYIQEMAACVLKAGQDVDSRAGLRLQRLFMELCCLYCVKARVDPREWRSMLKNAVSPEDSGPAAALQTTDYTMLTNLMQFTDTQKADISHMHSTYITNLARIATRRQQLLQQLQDAPQAQGLDFEELAASHEQLDAVTQKLQTCALDENQLLLHQQTSMAMRVDLWQSAVASVYCFPACPDVVAHARWLTEAEAAGMSQKLMETLAHVQRFDSQPHDQSAVGVSNMLSQEVMPHDVFG